MLRAYPFTADKDSNIIRHEGCASSTMACVVVNTYVRIPSLVYDQVSGGVRITLGCQIYLRKIIFATMIFNNPRAMGLPRVIGELDLKKVSAQELKHARDAHKAIMSW